MFGHPGESFCEVVYFAHGASGSGKSENDALPIETNAAVLELPANIVMKHAYVIIDTAVAGSTTVDVGDASDPDGYVATANLTLGTEGLYNYAGAEVGAYLNNGTDGNAGYLVSAATDLAVAVTDASTAGAFRLVLEGLNLGR